MTEENGMIIIANPVYVAYYVGQPEHLCRSDCPVFFLEEARVGRELFLISARQYTNL